MILLIDNYDSFTYNLYQLIGEITSDIKVIRNDEMSVDEIKAFAPTHIIISPGPGRPENAGNIVDVIKTLGKDIPILGICLGHQAICYTFGATITYAKKLMHGKQSNIKVDLTSKLFKGLKENISVARYHSLVANPSTITDDLKIIAVTTDGEVMSVEHKNYNIYGVQFHPESILTPDGKTILKNFLQGGTKND